MYVVEANDEEKWPARLRCHEGARRVRLPGRGLRAFVKPGPRGLVRRRAIVYSRFRRSRRQIVGAYDGVDLPSYGEDLRRLISHQRERVGGGGGEPRRLYRRDLRTSVRAGTVVRSPFESAHPLLCISFHSPECRLLRVRPPQSCLSAQPTVSLAFPRHISVFVCLFITEPVRFTIPFFHKSFNQNHSGTKIYSFSNTAFLSMPKKDAGNCNIRAVEYMKSEFAGKVVLSSSVTSLVGTSFVFVDLSFPSVRQSFVRMSRCQFFRSFRPSICQPLLSSDLFSGVNQSFLLLLCTFSGRARVHFPVRSTIRCPNRRPSKSLYF